MSGSSIEYALLTIFEFLIIIIFGGSVVSFVIAIYDFISSAGDTEKIQKAWRNIRYMITGIIMTIAFLFLLPILFRKLQIPGHEVYTAENIFNHTNNIVKALFSFGQTANEAVQSGEANFLPGGGSNGFQQGGTNAKQPIEL